MHSRNLNEQSPEHVDDDLSSSASTDATYELSPITPNKTSHPLRPRLLMRQPGVHDLLSLPDLDRTSNRKRMNIWTSDRMIYIYMIFAAATLFRDRRVLYLIPAYVLLEFMLLIRKWINFVADDPQIRRAQACLANHSKIIQNEIRKTQEGGFLRHQQEAIVAGLSVPSTSLALHFLEKQSNKIRHRAVEEHKRLLSTLGK